MKQRPDVTGSTYYIVTQGILGALRCLQRRPARRNRLAKAVRHAPPSPEPRAEAESQLPNIASSRLRLMIRLFCGCLNLEARLSVAHFAR